MKYELFALSDRLLSGALTGLYQGIGLALLVALGLRLLRRTNAATRHAVWFATLLLVTALMAGNCLHSVFSAPAAAATNPELNGQPVTEDSIVSLQGTAPPANPLPIRWGEGGNPPDPLVHGEGGPGFVALYGEAQATPAAEELVWENPVPNPTMQAQAADAAVPNQFEVEKGRSASLQSPQAVSGSAAPTFLEHAASRLGIGAVSPRFLTSANSHPISWHSLGGLGLPPFCAAGLVGILLLVCSTRTLLLVWHFYQLRRLKRGAVAPSDAMQFMFREVCRRLAVRRPVQLRVSSAIRSPVLLGFFNPVVLVPEPEPGADDLAKTRQIICHELAHVRRRDDWLNLAQHSLEAALFFQPVVRWISKRLSLEREIACDDLVLHQGGRPQAYALLLTELAGRLNGPRALIAPGVSASHSQLKERINMILNTNRNTSPGLALSRAGLLTSTAALLGVAVFYLAPRLVLAQDAPVPPVAPVPPIPAVQPRQPALPPVAVVTVAPEAAPVADEPEGGPKYKSQNLPPAPPRAVSPAPPAPRPFGLTLVAPTSTQVACDTTVGVAIAGPLHARALPGTMAMAGQGSSSAELSSSSDASSSGERLSTEERLDRLEKMVESLAAQQKARAKSGDVWFYSQDQQTLKRQAELSQQRADREMSRAREQMKRAAEEMERSSKDQALNGDVMTKDISRKQLDALRKAREGLQRQMEALDRQIERLEAGREKLKESSEDQPKEEQRRRSEVVPDKAGQKVGVGEVF